MKKFTVLLTLFVSSIPFVSHAQTEYKDGNVYYLLDKSNYTATIIGSDSENIESILLLPEEIELGFEEYYEVTAIGDYAFKDCVNLTDIIIPGNVVKLGDNVFYGCKNLTTVNARNDDMAPQCTSSTFNGMPKQTLYVLPDGYYKYIDAPGWSEFREIIMSP